MINKYLDIVGTVKEENGKLVVSSRIIAKGLGKQHNNVIRDLENILNNSENSYLSSLIIPSTYKVEGQNRTYKEYLLTKDGFILYMFNIQGYVDFKLAYIKEYNRMEAYIQEKHKLDYEKYTQKAIETNPLILELKDKVKNQIRIDYSQQRVIQKKINCKIELDYLLDLGSKSKRSWYMALYKGIKDKFQVASYRDLKQKDFDECVEFINGWLPPKYLFEE